MDGLGTDISLASVPGTLEAAAVSTATAADEHWGMHPLNRHRSATSIRRSIDGSLLTTGPLKGSKVRRAALNHAHASRGASAREASPDAERSELGRVSANSEHPLAAGPSRIGGGHQLPGDDNTLAHAGLDATGATGD